MGVRFLKIAVVYFVIGVVFGLVMGIIQSFQFASVHAHINLLGWVSLALCGFLYLRFPAATSSKLAPWHFWLHNIGLPVMIIGLYLEILTGQAGFTALIATGGTLAVVGIIIFAINVLMNVKSESAVTAKSANKSASV
ncbi:MAG: cytochrome-c oxidase [Paenibacillaceae bacterium]|jgi:cbb3-type cytochrome oxidase subunit 1|nr:cytochrome-c oxidase [Paenibacillaceae bacterium]